MSVGLGHGEYLEGLAFFIGTLGGGLGTAFVVHRRWLSDLPGILSALAFALAATAALVAAVWLPGVLGLLTREATMVAALGLAGAAALLARRRPSGTRAPAPGPPESPTTPAWSWALGIGGLAVAAIGAIAYALAQSLLPPLGTDAVGFELPTVARWMQLETLWTQVEHQPNISPGTYPHTGNLTMLVAMLPWGSAWPARHVDVAFVALAAAATYAIARELRAPAGAALLAAAAMIALPSLAHPALKDTQVDPQFVAWFAAGALFLLRGARLGSRRDYVLAGVALGLALGTKWYALLYVPIVIGVWLVASRLSGRRWGEVAPTALRLLAIVVPLGSFWLVRNWVEVGNPFHPTPLRVLGVTIFDAPRNLIQEQAGYSIADYLTDAAVWRDYLVPAFRVSFGALLPVTAAATIAGACLVALGRRRGEFRPGDGAILAAIAASALIALAYINLPYSAFGPEGRPILTVADTRWANAAFVGTAAVTAWLAGRAGRLRWVVEALLLLAVLDASRRAFDGLGAADVVRALALAAALAAVAVALRRVGRPSGAPAVAAAVAAAVAVAGIGGYWLERRWALHPYGEHDPTFAYIQDRAPAGASIGLASRWAPGGIQPILPAYGARLANRVQHVGRIVDGTLRRLRTEPEFRAALRRERYDLLLLGRGSPPAAGGAQPYLRWARAEGYSPVSQSARFVLLRR